MGRKKFMLDGLLRGRNELIQDSIKRDTSIVRDRKQVSSHLQVLKQHLKHQAGGKCNLFALAKS
jgi:transcriptional enhancer factor